MRLGLCMLEAQDHERLRKAMAQSGPDNHSGWRLALLEAVLLQEELKCKVG